MNKEELYFKLNNIYEEIIDIKCKLERQELEKRKKEAEESKKLAEGELREVEYQLNDIWSYKEKKYEAFNRRFEDIEKVE